jgi:hypothetical protein
LAQTASSEDPQAILTAGEDFPASPEGCLGRTSNSAGAATPFSFSFPFGEPAKFHERDHETPLTTKQVGCSSTDQASGNGGEVFKKNG